MTLARAGAASPRLSRRALILAGSALPLARPAPGQVAEPSLAHLAAVARALFPHAFLSDAHYARLAERWWQAQSAAERPAAAAALAAADPASPATLAALLGPPAGQSLRFALVAGLYGDPAVYRRFGYQGPSAEEGGYLERGFDDLDWLPRPEVTEAQPWLD
ncbi:MAG: hypothetical protein ACK40H_08930 [Sphingomonadaceae bacterium]